MEMGKKGIKAHLPRKRNDLRLLYDVKRPYSPVSFIDLGALNRHLYKRTQSCAYIEENKDTADWVETWRIDAQLTTLTDFRHKYRLKLHNTRLNSYIVSIIQHRVGNSENITTTQIFVSAYF